MKGIIKYMFQGVRGSYPVSHKRFNKYGGNTSSLAMDIEGEIVIFDAGTGIINIGNQIKNEYNDKRQINIFLTHLHIDHIQGLPFFNPFFYDEYKINIYCPEYENLSFKNIIYSLFNHPFSPISNKRIKAEVKFIGLGKILNDSFSLFKNISVSYIKEDSHPVTGVLIYKLSSNKKNIVFATDIESPEGFNRQIQSFINGADVLIHDSQYFDEEYYNREKSKMGFGHSTVSMAVDNAVRCGVKKLFLFHYDPGHSDEDLEIMLSKARKTFKNTYLSKELKENLV